MRLKGRERKVRSGVDGGMDVMEIPRHSSGEGRLSAVVYGGCE